MNKVAKEEDFESDIIKRISDFRIKKDLTKQELANTFGVSIYLLNKLLIHPNESRLSVWRKVTVGLGLKLSVK